MTVHVLYPCMQQGRAAAQHVSPCPTAPAASRILNSNFCPLPCGHSISLGCLQGYTHVLSWLMPRDGKPGQEHALQAGITGGCMELHFGVQCHCQAGNPILFGMGTMHSLLTSKHRRDCLHINYHICTGIGFFSQCAHTKLRWDQTAGPALCLLHLHSIAGFQSDCNSLTAKIGQTPIKIWHCTDAKLPHSIRALRVR